MKSLLLGILFASSALAAQAASVSVSLDDLNLFDFAEIEAAAPGFGDSGPVDLDWSVGGQDQVLLFFAGSYSQSNAGFCFSGTDCGLDLRVAPGSSVTLNRFDLGAYPDASKNISWSVHDLADMRLIASADFAYVDGLQGLAVGIGATSETGFRILFGPDGYRGGLTGLSYDWDAVTPVPLPASMLMLGAALGGIGLIRRRRRAA